MRKTAIILASSVLFLTARADERLPELPAGNEVYHHVTITVVTPTDVFFTCDEGMANVKIKNLDPAWQRHFHYDPANAGEVEKNQAAASRRFTPYASSPTEQRSGVANAPAAGAESADPHEYIQIHYNLKVTLEAENQVRGNLRVGAMTDTGQVNDYLRAMVKECDKYPADFFSRVGVSEVVLCGDLHMGPAPIAGICLTQEKKLYIQYHWCQYGARCLKSFHAFHHELGHAVQNAAWGNGHYDWREWAELNPQDFRYGGGGDQELIADPGKNWGVWTSTQPGFLNAYSTTAPWEDRSEIMAALMNDGDRVNLAARCRQDPVIQKKVELMSGLLTQVCGPHETQSYWQRALARLERQPETPMASDQPGPSAKVDLEKAIGGEVIDADGNAVSFDTLKEKKYFLLYFSASWCSHCREFMPQFVDFYQNSKDRDKFEVLLVSSDQSEDKMLAYLREMPWKAVRLNSAAESLLKTNYSHGPGIPTLALIDADGRLLFWRKGYAKNDDHGVDKVLDFLNQTLAAN